MNFGFTPNLFAWLWQAFLGPHDGAPSTAPAVPIAESPLLPELRLARQRLAQIARHDANAARMERALRRIEARLARPPRLALLGDFNSGKSSLAHLLLGGAMPSEGVIPETRAPVLFRHAEKPQLFLIDSEGARHPVAAGTMVPSLNGRAVRYVEAGLPLDLLRRVEIVDVPGTANPVTAAEAHALLPRIVRNVHLALWCTPAPQAWKGNEQSAWLAMPRRLKASSILVATQADRLREAADREKVLNRLQREAGGHFRSVVMISARQRALTIDLGATERERAKSEGANMDLWYAHGGAALWQALIDAIGALGAEREASAARVAGRVIKPKAASAKPVAASMAPVVPTPKPARSPQPKPATRPKAQPQPASRPIAQPQSASRSLTQTQPQSTPGNADLREALSGLWSRRAEAISARLARSTISGEALCAEFAGELHHFAHEALLPRLAQQYSSAQCDGIAALFLCDEAMLMRITSGMSADATARQLGRILTQLSEELGEALGGVPA